VFLAGNFLFTSSNIFAEATKRTVKIEQIRRVDGAGMDTDF